MMHDLINDAVSAIKNSERIGKAECVLRPTSTLLIKVLRVFQQEGYLGEFEFYDNGRGGSIRVQLVRKINDCGIIKPRHAVAYADYPRWEKRYLPARDFGTLIISTPEGVMGHQQAKRKHLGGRLLAYVY